jgi:hypothetical protein
MTEKNDMRFPAWVEGARTPKAQRATNRLKYILSDLALQHTGRNSMRALAEHVGYDHSTFSMYIRRGAFTEQAAQVLAALAPSLKVTYLTDPLSIPTK